MAVGNIRPPSHRFHRCKVERGSAFITLPGRAGVFQAPFHDKGLAICTAYAVRSRRELRLTAPDRPWDRQGRGNRPNWSRRSRRDSRSPEGPVGALSASLALRHTNAAAL